MADSSSLPDMRFYESRKESFILSGTGTNADLAQAQPGRRKASNNKASAAAAPAPLQWPHPIASSATATSAKSQKALYPTPSHLARLGAFYEPLGAEEADRCTIWPEGISVSGWTAGESALDRLRRVDPSVCWVRIEDSRAGGASTEKIDEEQGQARWYEWPASQGHLLPTSNEMYQARHMTFGGLWKYDGKKGWKPTSAKLAKAGFHYTPSLDEDDNVTCVYCGVSLGGWEKADDPTQEHNRRRPDCAFFNCRLASSTTGADEVGMTASSSSSSVKAPAAKRGKKGKANAIEEAAVVDEGGATAAAKRRAVSTRANGRAKKADDDAEEGGVTGDEVEESEEKAKKANNKPKRAARTVSRKVESADATMIDHEAPKTRAGRSGRSKKKGADEAEAATEEEEETGDEEAQPRSKEVRERKGHTKTKGSRGRKASNDEQQGETSEKENDEPEALVEEEKVETEKKKGKKQPTTAAPTASPSVEQTPKPRNDAASFAGEITAATKKNRKGDTSSSSALADAAGKLNLSSSDSAHSSTSALSSMNASKNHNHSSDTTPQLLASVSTADDVEIRDGNADDKAAMEEDAEEEEAEEQQGTIKPLAKLTNLSEAELAMTVEEWMKQEVEKACEELRIKGMRQIEHLRESADRDRRRIEGILRGG